MTSILIVGGYGLTGSALARHLLRQTDAEILLGGRSRKKARGEAQRLNEIFPGERAVGLEVDASSKKGLLRALGRADLVLVAAPVAEHVATVVEACLEAQVDYLDVQLDSRKLAYLQSRADEIEAAGRCFVTEAGFHPGLPAALVRLAGRELSSLRRATIGCYLNMGADLPYSESVDEVVALFRDYRGQVLEAGQWTRPGSIRTQEIDFGGEIGRRRCYSLFFDELGELPQMLPSLRQLGFYMSELHWFVDWILTPVVFLGMKLAPEKGLRPLGRLLWWGMQWFPQPPYGVVLKLVAEGEDEGGRIAYELTLSHPDGYELTAIPVVAYLRQYLDGSARRPGLWMMGHLADPVQLFTAMERMGVTIARGKN